jgi:hypothetical protein
MRTKALVGLGVAAAFCAVPVLPDVLDLKYGPIP